MGSRPTRALYMPQTNEECRAAASKVAAVWARRAGEPEAQVPATEVLVTEEPVTTEWMTRSRSKTTEKPL